jgi:hypothetical protein
MTIEDLAAFPGRLKEALALAGTRIRVRGSDGGFAIVEHLCHLADLEEEGYGARIEQLMAEERPAWDDFDGAAIAVSRNYLDQDPDTAYARFLHARNANLTRLRAAQEGDWEKTGRHRGMGDVSLRQIAEMMVEHDRDHAEQIETLLGELR